MSAGPVRATELPAAIERYFEALDAGQASVATESLADDAIMLLPPPPGDTTLRRVVLRSDEIVAMLDRRGAPPWRHQIVDAAVAGSTWLLEGVVHGAGVNGTFLVAIGLDPNGLIREYTAFRSDRRVSRQSEWPIVDRAATEQRFRTVVEAPSQELDTERVGGGSRLVSSIDSASWHGLRRVQCRHVAAGTSLVFALGTAIEPGSDDRPVDFMISAEDGIADSWERVLVCWAAREGTT